MSGDEVAVLMYHRLGGGAIPGREKGEDAYAIDPEVFEAHLAALQEARAQPLGFDALLGSSAAHGASPARFAVTFDDGNSSDHAVALPALRKREWPGIFFVVPAWVGTAGYMSWPEIGELRRQGMVVGAHGLDHAPFAALDDRALRLQLRDARHLLRDRLGTAPLALSLPGGSGGRRAVRLAREEGFLLVADSAPRLARPGRDAAPLPRFALRRGDGPDVVRALAERRRATVCRWRARHALLVALRAAMGEGLYSAIRGRWAERAGAVPPPVRPGGTA